MLDETATPDDLRNAWHDARLAAVLASRLAEAAEQVAQTAESDATDAEEVAALAEQTAVSAEAAAVHARSVATRLRTAATAAAGQSRRDAETAADRATEADTARRQLEGQQGRRELDS